MVHIEEEEKQKAEELKKQSSSGESLLQRKYVYPFVLAVLVLAFTQATGINSVLNYSVKVFQQAGLEGTTANWADFTIKVVNCLMTIVAMILVAARAASSCSDRHCRHCGGSARHRVPVQ